MSEPNTEAAPAADTEPASNLDPIESQMTQEKFEVPDKFKNQDGSINQEALVKSYLEMESKQSKPAEEPKAEPATEEPKQETSEDSEQATPAQAAINAAEKEFRETGKLSDETYQALTQKAGLSRHHVDSFIAGEIASQESQYQDIVGALGGEAEFTKLTEWMSKNSSPEEVAEYNDNIEKVKAGEMTADQFKLYMIAHRDRFVAETGAEPRLTGGDVGHSIQGYQSVQEAVDATKDPRYKTDPAYRRQHELKMRNSNIYSRQSA